VGGSRQAVEENEDGSHLPLPRIIQIMRMIRAVRHCCVALLLLCTIAPGEFHQHLQAQGVTRETPPGAAGASPLPELPQDPSLSVAQLPRAHVLEGPMQHASMDSNLQSMHGDTYMLSGDVVITYNGRTLRADTVTYNNATGELHAEGHIRLSDATNDESIQATRTDYNLHTGVGTFYDVAGSVGMHAAPLQASSPIDPTVQRPYTNSNPFLFSGKMVVKTGPEDYDVYDGTVTSCLLPNPDWLLSARHFSMTGEQVRGHNATFHLLGLPVLFFPFVTHPTSTEHRESGLLPPVIGFSNSSRGGSKGATVGEQVYLTLGLSVIHI